MKYRLRLFINTTLFGQVPKQLNLTKLTFDSRVFPKVWGLFIQNKYERKVITIIICKIQCIHFCSKSVTPALSDHDSMDSVPLCVQCVDPLASFYGCITCLLCIDFKQISHSILLTVMIFFFIDFLKMSPIHIYM